MEQDKPIDSNPAVPARYRSPAQKWAEAVKLRELAWNLKWAYTKQAHPEWNDDDIKKSVRNIFINAAT